MTFPAVFLPGNIVQPQAGAGQGLSVRRLEYLELNALTEAVGGGDIVARTPDPLARRYEYKKFLRRDLPRYEGGEPLQATQSLAQFKDLVEGIIFGHLTPRTYDLRGFNFAVPNHLRYLTVFSNRQGRVVGGADPDTLVFSAANAPETDFADLRLANNGSRGGHDGVHALELLRGFKENLQARNSWHPDHILWMRLLDRLFFEAAPAAPVNLEALREGWRQVGPVTLRVSVDAGVLQHRPLYLPMYEGGYLNKALRALSGEVAPVPGGLQLTVNGRAAGRIMMPSPGAAGDQAPLLLGAGNLVLQDTGETAPARINYDQLRPHLQSLVTQLRATPNPVQHVAREAPFDYPDVIRVPIQHDGFLGLDGLRGTDSGGFSERFLERMRGKRVLNVTPLSEGDAPPCLVKNQGIHCFADDHGGGVVYYVEEYQGERVEELRLLGYILWSVFDKGAEVDGERKAVVMRGKPVLEFSGNRFQIKGGLQCEWPNPRVKAATLQRLVGVLNDSKVPKLFRESVNHWIEAGFNQPIEPLISSPSPVEIGPYRWYVNNI